MFLGVSLYQHLDVQGRILGEKLKSHTAFLMFVSEIIRITQEETNLLCVHSYELGNVVGTTHGRV